MPNLWSERYVYHICRTIGSLRDVCHDDNENADNDWGYSLFKRVGTDSLDANLHPEDKLIFFQYRHSQQMLRC